MNWIKCSERLPKFKQMSLLTNGKDIGVGVYMMVEKVFAHNSFEIKTSDITHWMPLPELPTK